MLRAHCFEAGHAVKISNAVSAGASTGMSARTSAAPLGLQ